MIPIPKHAIELIVNRLHVSTPDAEIATDIRRRARRTHVMTESLERRIVAYALKVHHDNQKFFAAVDSGRL